MPRVSPQQIAASVTRVVEKKGTAGTAFAVGPSHLLTALHVAERGAGIARPDGSIVPFAIVDRRPELDLALIAVEAHGLLPRAP